MARLAVVCPQHYLDLPRLLADGGNQVMYCWPDTQGTEYAHLPKVGGVNLLKALRATGVDQVVLGEFDRLAVNASQGAAVFGALTEWKPDAIVTTATVDVPGRAAVYAGKALGVPVIHVSHYSPSISAKDAWMLRETPGDVILVAGERDKAWFESCLSGSGLHPTIEITGNFQWDGHANLSKRERFKGFETWEHMWVDGDRPTVCWIAESGANAVQTPLIWQFKDAPQRAWTAFLPAMQAMDAIVIIKVRKGEDAALYGRWLTDADMFINEAYCSAAPLSDVLPTVDLVVGQQSNALTEALMAGIPVVNLTRPGGDLLQDDVPSISILADNLDERLAELIREGLSGSQYPPERCRQIAAKYARNADGGARQRVVEAVNRVVGKSTHVEERELVLA